MSQEIQIHSEPTPQCRKCQSTDTRPFGRTYTKKYGIKLRYTCNKCGSTFGAGTYLNRQFSKEIIAFALEHIKNNETAGIIKKSIKVQFGVEVGESTIRKWGIQILREKRRSQYSNYAKISFVLHRNWAGRHAELGKVANVPTSSVDLFFYLFEHGAVLSQPEKHRPLIERHLVNIQSLLTTANEELSRIDADIRRANPKSPVGKLLSEFRESLLAPRDEEQ